MGNHKYPYWECDEHGRISTTVLVDHLVSQSDPRLLKEYQIQIEELQRRLANLEEESDILKTDLESRDLEETILV